MHLFSHSRRNYIISFYKIKHKMFEQPLNSFSQLPVPEKERKCTDCICTAIGAIFALVLFILAFVFMNKDHYYKSNFPTDSDFEPCSYGKNEQYPFVYFPYINDPSIRTCVAMCPQGSQFQIQCRTNSKVSSCSNLPIYQTTQQFERLGGFCAPSDDAAREKLVQNAGLESKWNFLDTYDVKRISLLIALGIGIIWMILVQIMPRIMAPGAVVLGSLLLLSAGVLLLVDNAQGWQGRGAWRIIIAVFLILFAVFFFIMVCLYRRRLKVAGILLTYAGKFLASKPINFIFIPIFLALTVGLIVLCMFEYLAFSSNSNPERNGQDIYLQLQQNPVLTSLVVIQFIWGMQFLKDTFNFFISGNAVQWYRSGNSASNWCLPVSRFLKFNFGSVVGGSFLNAFFNFIDFLFEALRCYPEGSCAKCAPCCTSFSKVCGCFCDLVRNDAYAYINLTGIPYCNAARNCEVLCNSSKLFIGSQSVMFFYRLLAHSFCVGLTALIAYALLKSKIDGINVQSLIIILILAYCIVTFFIDIHADAAQALQISYLTELQLSGGNPSTLASDFNGLKGELRAMDSSYQDGKC